MLFTDFAENVSVLFCSEVKMHDIIKKTPAAVQLLRQERNRAVRILDQRNFYSRKKLCWLGEWDGQTVLLEQTKCPEPFFQVLLLRGNQTGRSLLRTSLKNSVLRQFELVNGEVRVLLSCGSEIRILRLPLQQADSAAAQTAFYFCGRVTDACFAGENGCLVQTGPDKENALLYGELKKMTGRNAFLFYAEPQNGLCVPVQDFRLLDAPPRELEFSVDGKALCGLHHHAQEADGEDCEPPLLKSCVMWAPWRQLREALLRADEELPLKFPFCEESGSFNRIGKEVDRLFFALAGDGVSAVASLELSSGKTEKLAVKERAGEAFAFVAGMGCCRTRKEGDKLVLQPVNSAQRLVLPEKIGVPAAWIERRYLLSSCGNGAVCYDVQTRETTVYEGEAEFLPDGLLLC